MNKDITLCFRTNTNLKKSLEAIARNNKWSLSSTIENILTDYIAHIPEPKTEPDRRTDTRKDVMFPVLVSRSGEKDTAQYGMITDVSKGGLRISLPKEPDAEMWQDGKEIPLDLTMSLPGQSTPATISCMPLRLQKGEGKTEMGVNITGLDSEGYRKLIAFLREDDREP